jgi:hypothetical protein
VETACVAPHAEPQQCLAVAAVAGGSYAVEACSFPPAIASSATVDLCRTAECGCQTDTPTNVACAEAASAAECLEAQKRQLEAAHRELGDKGRELRRMKDTCHLLQSELQEERLLSEHYRLQVEVLEDQLRSTLLQRHEERRACGASSWRGGDFGSNSRPVSARGTSSTARAWAFQENEEEASSDRRQAGGGLDSHRQASSLPASPACQRGSSRRQPPVRAELSDSEEEVSTSDDVGPGFR